MPSSAEYLDLPFDEAIDYFRRKINLPTQTWTDLWEGMHARAFVVAGAMKSDLLGDLREAVDKGISQGTTLEEFREDFDRIIERSGWKYRGNRGWRTGVIFNTNVRVAYAAGHYKQMNDPDVLAARPFFRYVASHSRRQRPEHRKWYNIVLPADHPFWKTHMPPNGWGCKCTVVNHSAREVERLKQEEEIQTVAPPIQYEEWTDKTGTVRRVPRGIDPGWAYNPGEAAWGRQLSKEAMELWEAYGAAAWRRLTPGDWQTAGRVSTLPPDVPTAQPGRKLDGVSAIQSALSEILGGEERIVSVTKNAFRYDLLVNAETLAEQMDPAQSVYLPYLMETVSDPYEIWVDFERHRGTGLVVVRQRWVKGVDLGGGQIVQMAVQAKNGMLEEWIVKENVNDRRIGKLIWGR